MSGELIIRVGEKNWFVGEVNGGENVVGESFRELTSWV